MGGSGGADSSQIGAMRLRVVVRSEAEADISEAAQWYEEQRAGLGAEFIGEVRLAIQRIAEHPLAWGVDAMPPACSPHPHAAFSISGFLRRAERCAGCFRGPSRETR